MKDGKAFNENVKINKKRGGGIKERKQENRLIIFSNDS